MRMKAERSSAAAYLSFSACCLSAGAGVSAKADVPNSACRLSAAADVSHSACRLSAGAGVSAKADVSRQGGFSEIFLPLPHENQIHLHRKNRKVIPSRRGERLFDTIEALCFDGTN